MFARYLSSASAGIAVTTALLYLMQFLISIGPTVFSDPPPKVTMEWIDPPEPDPAPLDPPRVSRPPKPELLPNHRPLSDASDVIAVPMHDQAPPDVGTATSLADSRWSDGPLMTVFKVQPTYPIAAARRELEGYVTVQYDVLETGAVANAIVVESTDRIFEKAALAAAYRFRYKPRMVDGKPQVTRALLNRFRFRIEQ